MKNICILKHEGIRWMFHLCRCRGIAGCDSVSKQNTVYQKFLVVFKHFDADKDNRLRNSLTPFRYFFATFLNGRIMLFFKNSWVDIFRNKITWPETSFMNAAHARKSSTTSSTVRNIFHPFPSMRRTRVSIWILFFCFIF